MLEKFGISYQRGHFGAIIVQVFVHLISIKPLYYSTLFSAKIIMK